MTLTARRSIGTADNALYTEVGGKMSLVSGGELAICEKGDMNLDVVVKPSDTDVQLSSIGSISGDFEISGKHLDVNTPGGSAALKINVKSVSGTFSDDFTLKNADAPEIDDLRVGGKAAIMFSGAVTAGAVDEGTAMGSMLRMIPRM